MLNYLAFYYLYLFTFYFSLFADFEVHLFELRAFDPLWSWSCSFWVFAAPYSISLSRSRTRLSTGSPCRCFLWCFWWIEWIFLNSNVIYGWVLIQNLFCIYYFSCSGSLLLDAPSVRVEFSRDSDMTLTRALDVKTSYWDFGLSYNDESFPTHIRLVSSVRKFVF